MKKILSFAVILNLFFCTVANAEAVMYNTNTHKYHALWCRWAKKCTVNCIKIEKKQAIKRGGITCKVCGGGN